MGLVTVHLGVPVDSVHKRKIPVYGGGSVAVPVVRPACLTGETDLNDGVSREICLLPTDFQAAARAGPSANFRVCDACVGEATSGKVLVSARKPGQN